MWLVFFKSIFFKYALTILRVFKSLSPGSIFVLMTMTILLSSCHTVPSLQRFKSVFNRSLTLKITLGTTVLKTMLKKDALGQLGGPLGFIRQLDNLKFIFVGSILFKILKSIVLFFFFIWKSPFKICVCADYALNLFFVFNKNKNINKFFICMHTNTHTHIKKEIIIFFFKSL